MRNWLDLPEKASVWSWGNNWKKMRDIDIAVKNLPYHYKLENWEYTCEPFKMFKKNNQTFVEYKYSQYGTPLSQLDCRYFFV